MSQLQPQSSLRFRRVNFPRLPIYEARISTQPPQFARAPSTKGRRGLGNRYEQLVHQEFVTRYPGYLPSMWLRFLDRDRYWKWCQPDGLLVNPWQGILTIVEVKYSHTNDAFVQLFKVYLPVVQAIFGGAYAIVCCEVCKWYDPAVLTDEPPQLCKHPDLAPAGRFNCHIWKP